MRLCWREPAHAPIVFNMPLTNIITSNTVAPHQDFAVYVHWPFCLSKCPYCDFNSHVRHGGYDETRYLRAIESEIAATART